MKSYSQVKQDKFVLKMLENKNNGFYLEIGGNDPISINNTFLLESEFNWDGLSLEIDSNLVKNYNLIRKNKCYQCDALKIDYSKFLKEKNCPKQIDYLSIDIEPSQNTYNCLVSLPHTEYRFSVITFEHESYREGQKIRNQSRDFLSNLGYQLVVGDLKNNNNPFEDWYVDPTIVKNWQKYVSNDIDAIEYSNKYL